MRRCPPAARDFASFQNPAAWRAAFTLAMLAIQDFLGEQLAFCGLAAGIADGTGRAAGHGDGMMAEQLKPAQREQRHQVADVQAVRRRVEAAVKRDRAGFFFVNSAVSVQSATRPRHCNSSKMLTRAG
jgi:hypothetical protein